MKDFNPRTRKVITNIIGSVLIVLMLFLIIFCIGGFWVLRIEIHKVCSDPELVKIGQEGKVYGNELIDYIFEPEYTNSN